MAAATTLGQVDALGSEVVKHRLAVVDALERRMHAAGLSVRQAAQLLDVSPSTVSNWLRANVEPSVDRSLQLRVAAFLGCSPLEVLELFELELSTEQLEPVDLE